MPSSAPRRLIVTADDFGLSVEVNEAVEEAHRHGVLTGASLLVAGAAAGDAIRRARRLPTLGLGLHLALYDASPAAPPAAVPGLLGADGALGERPGATGAAIALSPALRRQVRREVAAQFEACARTGLPIRHLDGHWHCHEHPWVLSMAIAIGRPLGLRTVRIPFEPYRASLAAAGNRNPARRLAHAVLHRPLAAAMRRQVRRADLRASDWFFGKNDAGHVDADLLLGLIAHLPPGVSEIGLHPATGRSAGPHRPPAGWDPAGELAGLLDPRVRAACAAHGVRLCRFDDLG